MIELGIRVRDVVERFDLKSCRAESVLHSVPVALTVSRSGRCTIERGGVSFAFDPDDDEGDAAA